MSAPDVHYQMAKIDQTIDISRTLAKKEVEDPLKFARLIEICAEEKKRSVSLGGKPQGGISTSNCPLPSLFGGTHSKTECVILLLLTEKNVDVRASMANSLITKNSLKYSSCFRFILSTLIKMDQMQDFPKILVEILTAADTTAADAEMMKNETVVEALETLSSISEDKKSPASSSASEVSKQLVDLLKDDETRMKAFMTLNQLKSAYLVAVRMNSVVSVKAVAEEAKRTKQMTVKNICDRWLLQKTKQKN